MNLPLLRQEFAGSFRFWLTLALGLVLFAALMTALYPSVRDSYALMMKTVPSFLRNVVASRGGFSTFEGFIALAFSHPIFLALLGGWAIARGSEAVGGEIERGTLGWMLSYPIGRSSWVLTKAVVLLLGIVGLTAVFLGALLLALDVQHVAHAGLAPYARLGLMTMLLYGAIGTLTLWASAARSERGGPALWGSAAMLLAFLWNYVGESWAPIKPWRWLSPFSYYDPRALLYGNPLEPRGVAVLAGLLVCGLIAALATFRRRDLSI